jgi:hypothetical protein
MTFRDEPAYRNDEEVAEVVRRFEDCSLSPDEFKHLPHLTVALSYNLRLPGAEALEQMRLSIRRFIAHHALPPGVYHETLTVFWMRRVRSVVVAREVAERKLFELANELAKECGSSRLVDEYFSKELISSEGARAGWVEPDLKPLDF